MKYIIVATLLAATPTSHESIILDRCFTIEKDEVVKMAYIYQDRDKSTVMSAINGPVTICVRYTKSN